MAVSSSSSSSSVNNNNNNDCPKQPTYWSGRQNVTIQVGSITREFQLYTPWEEHTGAPDYITGPPLSGRRPLVINWHGCSAHVPIIDYHTEISKVTEEASNRGYYAITPVGTKSAAGDFGWNADGIECGKVGVDDFAFFQAILNFSSIELCVDVSRVYTVGFSTGAFLSYGIACRYPDLIAGAGADAGGLSLNEYQKCLNGSGAVPMQAFHSLDDPTVPYNGTTIWAGQEAMDELWRERNGCDGSEIPVTSFKSDTTVCTLWNCPLAPVETCALSAIDHCWYGGRSGGFQSCAVRAGDVDATVHMFDSWDKLSAGRAK